MDTSIKIQYNNNEINLTLALSILQLSEKDIEIIERAINFKFNKFIQFCNQQGKSLNFYLSVNEKKISKVSFCEKFFIIDSINQDNNNKEKNLILPWKKINPFLSPIIKNLSNEDVNNGKCYIYDSENIVNYKYNCIIADFIKESNLKKYERNFIFTKKEDLFKPIEKNEVPIRDNHDNLDNIENEDKQNKLFITEKDILIINVNDLLAKRHYNSYFKMLLVYNPYILLFSSSIKEVVSYYSSLELKEESKILSIKYYKETNLNINCFTLLIKNKVK